MNAPEKEIEKFDTAVFILDDLYGTFLSEPTPELEKKITSQIAVIINSDHLLLPSAIITELGLMTTCFLDSLAITSIRKSLNPDDKNCGVEEEIDPIKVTPQFEEAIASLQKSLRIDN